MASASISQLEVNGTTYDICDATARDSLSQYVLKAGDTMTGSLTILSSETQRFRHQSTIADLTLANNGLTAGYNPCFGVFDKNNVYAGWVQALVKTDGGTQLFMGARNKGTGSEVSNTLALNVANDGTKSVTLSDASAWRSAMAAVNKAGDTMTGNLTFSNSNNIYLNDPRMDVAYNATISAQVDCAYYVRDANNRYVAAFRGRETTAGDKMAMLEAHGYNSSGTDIWNSITVKVSKTGARSYSVSDATAFRTAIGAAGTGIANEFTSNQYIVKTDSPELHIKNTTMDISASTMSYNSQGVIWFSDKNGRNAGTIWTSEDTAGKVTLSLRARRYNSSTNVDNSLIIAVDKSGNKTYTVSAPAAFCAALHVGDYQVASASDVSVPTATYKDITNITLAAGTWVVFSTLEFATNTEGRRIGCINTTAGGTGISLQFRATHAPITGGPTRVKVSGILNPTASTKYYLTAWQGSGSTLNCTGSFTAVRLK